MEKQSIQGHAQKPQEKCDPYQVFIFHPCLKPVGQELKLALTAHCHLKLSQPSLPVPVSLAGSSLVSPHLCIGRRVSEQEGVSALRGCFSECPS